MFFVLFFYFVVVVVCLFLFLLSFLFLFLFSFCYMLIPFLHDCMLGVESLFPFWVWGRRFVVFAHFNILLIRHYVKTPMHVKLTHFR